MYLEFFPFNWKVFSFGICLSISTRKWVGIEGLLLWKHLYALHKVVMPFSSSTFVYRLVTSIDTRRMFSGTTIFSMPVASVASVASLRYESSSLAIGWSRLSTNDDIPTVGPLQPDVIGLLTGCRILGYTVDLLFKSLCLYGGFGQVLLCVARPISLLHHRYCKGSVVSFII